MNLFYRIAGNTMVLVFAIVFYLGFLGPVLISAPSTIAVLLGLAIAGLIAFWAFKMPKLIARRAQLSNNRKESTNR